MGMERSKVEHSRILELSTKQVKHDNFQGAWCPQSVLRGNDGKVGVGGADSTAGRRCGKTKAKGRKGVRHVGGGTRQKSVEGGGSWACVAACSLGAVVVAVRATWWRME
jgi:hypothetical protein